MSARPGMRIVRASAAFKWDVLAALERQPGVEAAGLSNFFPASDATLNYQIVLEGIAGGEQNSTFTVGSRSVSVGYLKAVKFPLVAGEWCPALQRFTGFDKPVPGKAMVNRRFAELIGKGQNVIGRHFRFLQNGANFPMDEIVGVIGDAKEDGLGTSPSPYVYSCISAGSWPD